MRGSRKFYVKGDPTLTTFVFKVDEGREDPSPTLSGPSSARQRNAIKLRFAGTPINAQLRSCDFQGIRTCIARKPYIFVIFQGSGPGSAHVISRYFGTYNVRQRLRRACASVHFQYSIDGSGMSSITAFVEWINFVSNNSNHNLEKRPFCIQVYLLSKFTQLFNAVVCMAFLK